MPDNNESIYGANAITGTKEDALAGRDVQIMTSNTQKISLTPENTDATQVDQNKPQDQQQDPNKTPEANPQVTPEAALATEIQQAKQANTDVQKELTAKGIDFDGLTQEYETSGSLSAESIAKLEAAGYPKSAVQAYIAGMEATSVKFENTVYEYAGGRQEYAKMAEFITGLGQGYVQAFDKTVETGDLTHIQMAIQGIKSQMALKYGTNNRTIMGGSGNTASAQGFTDKSEMTKAMSDPRYGRNKSYTEEVQTKVIRSTFLR